MRDRSVDISRSLGMVSTLPPSTQRYWRSVADARGSVAPDASADCNAGLGSAGIRNGDSALRGPSPSNAELGEQSRSNREHGPERERGEQPDERPAGEGRVGMKVTASPPPYGFCGEDPDRSKRRQR